MILISCFCSALKVNLSTSTPLNFKWPNGNLVSSAQWSPGEPNNAGWPSWYCQECCAYMASNNNKYNDDNCWTNRDVYCEYQS